MIYFLTLYAVCSTVAAVVVISTLKTKINELETKAKTGKLRDADFLLENLPAIITHSINDNCMTQNHFARLSKLGQSTISDICTYRSFPTTDTVRKIIQTLIKLS